MNSLLIPRNLTALLQTLRDCVKGGYIYWTSGTIKTLKAESLCRKFEEHYNVLASKSRRQWNLQKKRASSYLFMYPQAGGDQLDWILIATKGKGAIHEKETLHDHRSDQRSQRLKFRHYEIVKLNQRMTWRLRREVVEEWEKKLVAAARKVEPADLKLTMEAFCRFPMFTGVRQQVWTILQKAYRTQVRHNHDPIALSKLPILRRIKVYNSPPKTLGSLVDEYHERIKRQATTPVIETLDDVILDPLPQELEAKSL